MATSFLQSGVNFQDGNTYPASSLSNAVNNAVLLKTVITQWTAKNSPVGADQVLLYDSVADALKSCTITGLQGASYVFYGATDTGSANTYVVNVSPTPSAYSQGTIFVFLAANANTGASTFNANGLGAVDIQFNGSALVANQILAGGYYVLGYNGSKFEILNPSPTAISNAQLATMASYTLKANSGTSTSVPSNFQSSAVGFNLLAATSTSSQQSILGLTKNACSVNAGTATQSIPSGTATLVNFTTATYDTFTNFDLATDKFTATVEGTYSFKANVEFPITTTNNLFAIALYKNGSAYKQSYIFSSNIYGFTLSVAGDVYLNGSTDYVQVFVSQNSGGALNIGGSSIATYFDIKN